ncbi:MAG TPA: hypothetical protein VGX28_16325 [Frankiaceae bacterium]|nr:hypothetical protein [Frankiaceae bacterium]
MRAQFHNMDNRWHANVYVVWGRSFDAAPARLGVSPETFDALTEPLVRDLIEDPERYAVAAGTRWREAPLKMPDGTALCVRYTVAADPDGGTRVTLDHVTVPDRAVAP